MTRRSRLLLVAGGAALGLLLAECLLWLVDLPRSTPFFQEFTGNRFKLMCYDRNFAGNLNIDLDDRRQRLRYISRLRSAEFDRHWAETPYAIEVQYNSHGFRNAEFEPPSPVTRRIVVLGDSFTYGHGLAEPDCYPRRLETLLRSADGDETVEVLNCGSGGDNLDRIAQVARFTLSTLEPDVLIYGYFLNDPHPSRRGYDEQIHPMLDVAWRHQQLARRRYSLGAWDGGGLRSWRIAADFVNNSRLTRATLDWYRALHQPRQWKPAGEQIAEMAELAKLSDCRFVLVILPVIWELDGDYPLAEVHARIVAFADERGIECIDMLPELRGYADGELMLHPHDRHPNPRYARLVAEALAERLGGG